MSITSTTIVEWENKDNDSESRDVNLSITSTTYCGMGEQDNDSECSSNSEKSWIAKQVNVGGRAVVMAMVMIGGLRPG